MRRSELVLLLAFAAALVIAGFIGIQLGPTLNRFDWRLSTLNRGPDGALGLARTLEALGVEVERGRRPFFQLEEASPTGPSERLALLDLTVPPSASELLALRDYVEAGGSLFIAGPSGAVGCFRVGVTRAGVEAADATPAPPGTGELPSSTRRLFLLSSDSIELASRPARPTLPSLEKPEGQGMEEWEEAASDADSVVFQALEAPATEGCRIEPTAADTLWADTAGAPLALDLRFAGGGRVLVLADGTYLSNESLRETDAGALVIPWLLAGTPERIVFDEYHHGFGRNRSLWLAAGSWLISRPGGWAILQVCLAAAIALAVAAIRFGPARSVVERKRRSALEHLEALATGLQRARGHAAAIDLMIEGLRRRASRGATTRGDSRDARIAWLDRVVVATATPAAREAHRRLVRLAREADSEETVLEAAQTVEILWNELGRRLSA